MPLFQIQDNDRPLWIIARDCGEAYNMWRAIIARENDISGSEVEPPLGISFVCEDGDLVYMDSVIGDTLPRKRLDRIAEIIEGVEQRCMAADGPVTPTLQEMRQSEIFEIYELTKIS